MNFQKLFSVALASLLLLAQTAIAGNGVERGYVRRVLKSPEMRKTTKDLIEDSLNSRCYIGQVHSLRAKTKIRYEGENESLDRFFTVEFQIVHSKSRSNEPSSIKVEAAEYDIGKPSRTEEKVLSIDSEICR
jgi:hypothetical protein